MPERSKVWEAARPYKSLGLKHHDHCLAHGMSAPRDCWRQLWGGVITEGPYPDLKDTDPQLMFHHFVMDLTPPAQARVICGAGALMDDDVPPMEAFLTCLIWEGGERTVD